MKLYHGSNVEIKNPKSWNQIENLILEQILFDDKL